MSHYKHHVFFCCNQREPGENCCQNHKADELRDYAKKRVKALGLDGKGKVRVNKAGCLDRCDEGPVIADGSRYTVAPFSLLVLIGGRHA